jgi:organic radical activating enzyme
MFYITEEFFSIQGEGKYAGYPSYFLRTGGCNLACPGFNTKYSINGDIKSGCDTYFAVDTNFKDSWQKVETPEPLIKKLDLKFKEIGYNPHVVVTGGEPLLYYRDYSFYSIIKHLVDKGIKVTFETNASITIDFNSFPAYKNVIFSLSVKLSNSGEPKNKRVNINALKAIRDNAKEYFFKFTISNELIQSSAQDEIKELTSIIPDAPIYCMPVGECRESIWKNDSAVFNFCKENNYIYSDRLHIRVYDKTQGV